MSDAREPRALLRACFDAAVQGASPFEATWEYVAAVPITGRVHLLALGKAAHAQVRGAVAALEDRGVPLAGGCIVAVAHEAPPHPALRLAVGDHPVPGPGSLAAADAVQQAIDALAPGDQLLVCLSGGTTSLAAAPLEPIGIEVLAERFARLLAGGADIVAMNRERRSWLRWADGRLARAALARGVSRIDVCVVSDVLGDDLAIVGSGPCWCVPPEDRVAHTVIASNRVARRAAARVARASGATVVELEEPITGDARAAGRAFAARLLAHERGVRPTVFVAGGEPTMTLEGAPPDAAGGRMQAFALAAAIDWHEARERGAPMRHVTLLAAGTDGRDGPTDAAGAIVDAGTVRRIAERGRQAKQDLSAHRSYHALGAASVLLRTGPTGTNVADLVLGYLPAR